MLSIVLTVAAVSAVFFATYALAYGGLGTFSLYNSVKVLIIGTVVAGLGAILTVRMAKKVFHTREEMKASDDQIDAKAQKELKLLTSQLKDANKLPEVNSMSLKAASYNRDGEVINSVGKDLLDDLQKSSDKSKERGLLGVVLVIVALVMFTMVVSALATGVTTGNAMMGVWLFSSIAGLGIGGALVVSGVKHHLDGKSRSKEGTVVNHLRALEKHPDQLQAKIDAIQPPRVEIEEE